MRNVGIIGFGQSNFCKSRTDVTFAELVREGAQMALDDAGVTMEQIEAVAFPLAPDALIGVGNGERWCIDTLLGVGGMAAVYAATHRNGSRVAIKILHPELSASGEIRARFLREGYTANSVQHEGVVRASDDDVTPDAVGVPGVDGAVVSPVLPVVVTVTVLETADMLPAASRARTW